jgi:hypothetical protein
VEPLCALSGKIVVLGQPSRDAFLIKGLGAGSGDGVPVSNPARGEGATVPWAWPSAQTAPYNPAFISFSISLQRRVFLNAPEQPLVRENVNFFLASLLH